MFGSLSNVIHECIQGGNLFWLHQLSPYYYSLTSGKWKIVPKQDQWLIDLQLVLYILTTQYLTLSNPIIYYYIQIN